MKQKHDMSELELDERHAIRMEKRKAARNRMLSTKTKEKGLLIVHTGKGKGKSTAAFGIVMRALGNNMKVGIIQFVKGKWETGERSVLENFQENITIRTMGEGFTWDTQDRQRDIAAARSAWAAAQDMINDDTYDIILLDELNIVLRYDYLPIDMIVKTLKNRRHDLHIIVTGRNAKAPLIEVADMVTEMTEIKHHFRSVVKAQHGIEF